MHYCPPVILLLLLVALGAACRTEESVSSTVAPAPAATSAPTRTPDPAVLQATLEAALPPVPTPNERGAVLRILEDVRLVPLAGEDGATERWLAYTTGLRGIDPPRYHALEVYASRNGAWVLDARHELALLDALAADGVTLSIENGAVWIEVRGRGGLFSECFTLLRLEETTFTKEIEQCFREF